MKTFQLKLADGEKIRIKGARMTRDGSGVQIHDADDDVIAAFMLEEVKSAYEIQPDQTDPQD